MRAATARRSSEALAAAASLLVLAAGGGCGSAGGGGGATIADAPNERPFDAAADAAELPDAGVGSDGGDGGDGGDGDGSDGSDGGDGGGGSGDVDAAPAGPTPPCGTGTWRPGALEIHHLAIGQADATLIVGPTGRSLVFDAGEAGWESAKGAMAIGSYVERVLGCRRVDYVVISHFHVDHVGYVGKGGLWHLVNVQGFEIGALLHRDIRAFAGNVSKTFELWREYLEGPGAGLLKPQVAVEGAGQVDLGSGVAFKIVATDGNAVIKRGDFSAVMMPPPPSENDYSIAAVLRFGAFDYFIGGDLSGAFYTSEYGYTYHDIETTVAREIGDIDVYRSNHHGSDHSSNATFLAQTDPEVSIVSIGDTNGYGHPRPNLMQRLLVTSVVYLTQRGDVQTDIGAARVAGAVVVRTTDGQSYTVNGESYAATDPVRIDADGDGYFREADPDDGARATRPTPVGGCDPAYQDCAGPSQPGESSALPAVPSGSRGRAARTDALRP